MQIVQALACLQNLGPELHFVAELWYWHLLTTCLKLMFKYLYLNACAFTNIMFFMSMRIGYFVIAIAPVSVLLVLWFILVKQPCACCAARATKSNGERDGGQAYKCMLGQVHHLYAWEQVQFQ